MSLTGGGSSSKLGGRESVPVHVRARVRYTLYAICQARNKEVGLLLYLLSARAFVHSSRGVGRTLEVVRGPLQEYWGRGGAIAALPPSVAAPVSVCLIL